jgi:hypothetical protein
MKAISSPVFRNSILERTRLRFLKLRKLRFCGPDQLINWVRAAITRLKRSKHLKRWLHRKWVEEGDAVKNTLRPPRKK